MPTFLPFIYKKERIDKRILKVPRFGSILSRNSVYQNGASASATVYGVWTFTHCLIESNTLYDNNGTNLVSGANCTLVSNVLGP